MISVQKKEPQIRLKSKALREIRHEQSSTKQLIPNAPFCRIVKEIMDDHTGCTDYRMRRDAVQALQADAESFVVEMFNESNRIAIHCGRETLSVADIKLWKGIKDN